MEPLAKIVGNARIVALGEATHGTCEFFQLQHRRFFAGIKPKNNANVFSVLTRVRYSAIGVPDSLAMQLRAS